MNLLSLCQSVAGEAGFDVPTTIAANSDTEAVLLMAMANKTGRLLRYRAWQVLQKEATILTASGTDNYALPDDYLKLINDTLWDRSNYWQVRGSLSPQDWQAYQSGLIQTTVRKKIRIKGNRVYVFPTPSVDNEELVYEYVSKNWVTDMNGLNPSERYAADTDVSLINDDVIQLGTLWRYLERRGFAYQEVKDEFERQVDICFGSDVPKPILNLSGPISGDYTPPAPIVPITGYGGV